MSRKKENVLFRVLFSRWFLLSVLLITLLCMFNTMPEEIISPKESILKAMFKYSRAELAAMGDMVSAYNIIMCLREIEWFVVVFPTIVSIPVLSIVSDEYGTGYFTQLITRTDCKRYSGSVFATAAISGFLVSACSIALFTLICYLKLPQLSGLEDTFYVSMVYGETGADLLRNYLLMLFNVSFQGSISALVVTCFYMLLRDKFYALSIPMFIEYLGTKFQNYYLLLMAEKYGNEQGAAANIPMFFCSVIHMNMDMFFERMYKLNYGIYIAIMTAVILLLYRCIYILVRRRISI